MRLLIGQRRYSSWSLRGWLLAKLSGLPFETELLPFDSPAFAAAVAEGRLPSGRVPMILDGDASVWETIAIAEWLAERSRVPFWPETPAARALARSIAAEMHGGFAALRETCPMDLHRTPEPVALTPAAAADLARVDALWQQARGTAEAAHGPFLFGRFGAADAMYAPVAHRVRAYALPVSPGSAAWVEAVLAHPWLAEWTDAIGDEPGIAEHRL